MKTAVSIPDDVFHAADRAARELGYSRSQLYAQAIRRFLQQQGDDPVTAALNGLYQDGVNTAPANVGRQLIDDGAWTW